MNRVQYANAQVWLHYKKIWDLMLHLLVINLYLKELERSESLYKKEKENEMLMVLVILE